MTSTLDGTSQIRLAPGEIRRGPGRASLREIVDYGATPPAVLLAVPRQGAYEILAALRAAWRDGHRAAGGDRHDDPRWWSSECSRCCGVEWHRADCREAEDAEYEPACCRHCQVMVVSYQAAAAARPGPWHEPGCPLAASRDTDTRVVIEVRGSLSRTEFRRVGQLLDHELGRHKSWSAHYVFGPVTTERADAVCAYLQDLGIAHDRETTTSWAPASTRPG
jgi:hypothetical protein